MQERSVSVYIFQYTIYIIISTKSRRFVLIDETKFLFHLPSFFWVTPKSNSVISKKKYAILNGNKITPQNIWFILYIHISLDIYIYMCILN